MTVMHSALADFEDALGDAVEFTTDHQLDWMDWTHRQHEYISLVAVAFYTLFRAGNQVGKTIVGAALTIWACLGYHPDGALTKPPIEAWVVCTSWQQAVAVMKKVWELVPKDALVPGQKFDPRSGFGKENPALVFLNGSILRFKTTGQGAEALASATIHWVWIDEPTDQDIYRELQKRVRKHRGRVIITLTPVNRPCEWLTEEVKRGAIREVHARLDATALTFRGSGERMKLADGTPMDDAWIEGERLVTPSLWAPVVLDGEWETRPQGVFFTNFDPDKHVSSKVQLKPPKGIKLHYNIGIDYAAADRDFGQVAVLSQVLEVTRANGMVDRWVYVLDEVVLTGTADSDEFGDEIVGMLNRNRLSWEDLTDVFGDNPVASKWEEKSNLLTKKAIARRLRRPEKGLKPLILNAKDNVRAAGSRDVGLRFLYGMFSRGRLMIHPRCTHLIKAFTIWDYSRDHPYNDIIDALRYSLKKSIFPHGGTSGGITVRVAA